MEASDIEIPEEYANPPKRPDGAVYIWAWFCELQTHIDQVFTYQEMDAWARLTKQHPTPAEALFLRELSQLYVKTLCPPTN